MLPHEQPDQVWGLSTVSNVAGLVPIPYGEEVLFRDSSFFQKPNAATPLPSPNEVREVASRSTNPRATIRTRPPPVCFPGMGLLVKYGTEVTVAEGQCLFLVRRTLSQAVPVPEVYGWCKDDGQVFIYMELIDGVTLEKSWETLIEDDRLAICQQLRHMIDAWRSLKHDSTSPLIGKSMLARTNKRGFTS
jgi:hypothetical protein